MPTAISAAATIISMVVPLDASRSITGPAHALHCRERPNRRVLLVFRGIRGVKVHRDFQDFSTGILAVRSLRRCYRALRGAVAALNPRRRSARYTVASTRPGPHRVGRELAVVALAHQHAERALTVTRLARAARESGGASSASARSSSPPSSIADVAHVRASQRARPRSARGRSRARAASRRSARCPTARARACPARTRARSARRRGSRLDQLVDRGVDLRLRDDLGPLQPRAHLSDGPLTPVHVRVGKLERHGRCSASAATSAACDAVTDGSSRRLVQRQPRSSPRRRTRPRRHRRRRARSA